MHACSAFILYENSLNSITSCKHGVNEIKCLPPYTPLLYNKTGMYKGIQGCI